MNERATAVQPLIDLNTTLRKYLILFSLVRALALIRQRQVHPHLHAHQPLHPFITRNPAFIVIAPLRRDAFQWPRKVDSIRSDSYLGFYC